MQKVKDKKERKSLFFFRVVLLTCTSQNIEEKNVVREKGKEGKKEANDEKR